MKYPIGNFQPPTSIDSDLVAEWKGHIRNFPEKISASVKELDDDQLALEYRPGGWNIRQVVHHCADSHMNAFIRFKLSLTQERPTINPYRQGDWAELADSKLDVGHSLSILSGLHQRWYTLIDSMDKNDFRKVYYHPEMDIDFRLDVALALYSWHSRHHMAHIHQALAAV